VLSITERPILPDELVESIILDLWLPREIPERWDLYRALVSTCQQWRRIMLHVRFRWMILETAQDCRLYKRIIKHYLDSIPTVKLDIDIASEGTTSPSDEEPEASIFASSHVRAQYDLTNYAPKIIPDCRSMKLTVRRGGPLTWLNKWCHYPSLTTLSIEFPPGSTLLVEHQSEPKLLVNPHITSLHIHYPHVILVNSPKDMIKAISEMLPNVAVLRLSGPFPLIHVAGSFPNMETIILESPLEEPFTRTPSGQFENYYAMHWTIIGAVSHQLFRKKMKDGGKNRLILNTAAAEPKGWDRIVAGCWKYGVEAKYYAVYF